MPRHITVKFQSARDKEKNIEGSKEGESNRSHTKNQDSEWHEFLTRSYNTMENYL